jgi:hypothetical protein
MEKLYICMETDSGTTLVGILTAIRRGTDYNYSRVTGSNKLECFGTYRFEFKLGDRKLPDEIVSAYFKEFTRFNNDKLNYKSSFRSHSGTGERAVEDFLYQFLPRPEDPDLDIILKSVEDKKYKEWELLKIRGANHKIFRLYEKLPEGTVTFEEVKEYPAVAFKNKLIEDKAREARDIDDDCDITTEDLSYLSSSIAILEANCEEYYGFLGYAPWESTGTCFNMRLPALEFSPDELPKDIDDWRQDMQTLGIKTCYFGALVSLDYLLALPELTELYFSSLHDIRDWSFLEKLPELEMAGLYGSGDGDNAVKHLASLEKLNNLIIIGMGVTDLTPFEGKRFSELNLRDNRIKDTKPLAGINAYYLKLQNNLIEEIDAVNVAYLLDLSGNRIKSVKNLLDSGTIYHIRRLFLSGDELPDSEKAEIESKDYLVCEL